MDIAKIPKNKYSWALFFLLLIAAMLSNLGLVSFIGEEPRRAIVALEMSLSGEYLVPKINGIYYYNKAPVFNWVLLLFTEAFNSNENAIFRLPTIFSFLGIALIHFQIVKIKLSRNLAILSSLFFITCSNLLFYFSLQAEIDLFYSLIIYIQVLCILHYFQKEDYFKLFIFSYLLAGIGFLTKGLPSLAFQAITLVTVFLYFRRYRQLFSIWNFVGILLMITVIGGYFYAYSSIHDPSPMFTRLITESTNRSVLNHRIYSLFDHLYKFPLLLISIIFPWVLVIPSVNLRKGIRKAWQNEWIKLNIIFIVPNLIVYWLSPGTKDRYLYMFLPSVLLVITYLIQLHPRKYFSWFILTIESLGIVIACIIPFYYSENTIIERLISSLVLLVGSGILIILFFKQKSYRIFHFIVFMIVCRIAFNFSVLPRRAQHRTYYTQQAQQIVDSKVEKYITHQKTEVIYNPFLFREVELKTYNHPAYQTSFYYSKLTGKPLLIDTVETAGEFYLRSTTELFPSKRITSVDTLVVEATKANYMIYKAK